MISAVGHYVPDKKLTNKDLEQMVDTSDEWIRTRTGIRERRILEKDKGTSHMAVEAARMALKQKNLSPADIDLIIVATTTPDMTVPPTAAFVQKELKAVNCWGYDLNGACSGFLFALATGAQFIESGRHQKVLVIGADKMSAIIDYQDRNTCVLFGDAGGAVLLEPNGDQDLGITDYALHLDGSGSEYLRIAAGGSLVPTSHETVANRMHYLYQDGKTVFKFAVNGMTAVVEEILNRNGLNGGDIGLFIPHQANFRIIDAVAKKIGLRTDQVMLNIERYGNTTAATIPLAMSEAYLQQRMQKGDWIVIAAFGAGFTWGSLLLKWALD